MKRIKYILGAGITTLVLALGLALPKVVGATVVQNPDKVTICHRTNSVKNPYVRISVDKNAADGVAGNSTGNKPDHMGEHTGPIATSEAVAQSMKDNKQKWGDIIPDAANGGSGSGLNWTTVGQTMYNNNCHSGQVQGDDDQPTEVIPAAVTFTAPTCSALGSYTIPTTAHVDYLISSNVVAAGTYTAQNGSTVTVVAEAKAGFFVDDDTTDTWTNTFTAPSGCGNVLSDTTQVAAQVSAVPTGGVGAGGGGATSSGAAAGIALLGSSATLGLGLFLRNRWTV